MIYRFGKTIIINEKIVFVEFENKKTNNMYLLKIKGLENGNLSIELIEKQFFLTYLINNNYIQGYSAEHLQHKKNKHILKEITAEQYKQLIEDTQDIYMLIKINTNYIVIENTENSFNLLLKEL